MLNSMDCRGFASVEEMNTYMIHQWNKKVNRRDEVVILGDFSFGTAEETNDILKKLNGILYLIQGNHDHYLKDKHFLSERFQWIQPYKELKDNGRKVVLSHYPVICYHGQYRRNKNGTPKTYMLYGHVHNTFDEYLVNHFQNETRNSTVSEGGVPIPCQMINCFCMFSDYTPLSLDEWIQTDNARRIQLTQSEQSYGSAVTCFSSDLHQQ